MLKTADKYGNGHPSKSYPKRKLLPEFNEEAIEPPPSRNKEAAWLDRRPDDRPNSESGAAHKPTNEPGKTDGPARSIYGPKKKALGSKATRQVSEDSGTPKYRGAAHPLCFTNEVLDHEFPAGFKPINIEAYDGTTDPGVWIEDYILHIHMARGDDLHAIKYLPLKPVIGSKASQKTLLEVGKSSRTRLEQTFKELMSVLRMQMI